MSAKDDCYKLIQQIAVLKDPFCVHGCGRRSSCGHHVFKRDRLATAFDPDLVVGLCAQCHTGWAHGKDADDFKQFMIKRIGKDAFYAARRRSNEIVKGFEYERRRDELRFILQDLMA